ncbi:MAG TPA: hypothetical protein ENH35_00220 [Candidatus Moranbacteria bacterium]|nr:hypothetical protein [Candidatus Moranbacteria bacterium]
MIVAADVADIESLKQLIASTIEVPGIGGYKLGIELGLGGLGEAATVIHKMSEGVGRHIAVIYDHQKAGNDIPPMGDKFALKLRDSGIDAAILFPFAGPATQKRWTEACVKVGLDVITGGVMTHDEFLVSEGGYISDDAPERIYRLATELGVRHFVVPGTKIHWVEKINKLLDELIGSDQYVLYAPGFIDQGGDISVCGNAAGEEWHAIVGTAIYGKGELNSPDEMRKAAEIVTKQIAA